MLDIRASSSSKNFNLILERGKHWFVVPRVYAFIGWFLYVLWLGDRTHSLGVSGLCSNQLSYQVRASGSFLISFSYLWKSFRMYTGFLKLFFLQCQCCLALGSPADVSSTEASEGHLLLPLHRCPPGWR